MAAEVQNRADPRVADICKLAGIEAPAGKVEIREFIQQLADEGKFPDAVKFAANSLEPAAAIRWAYVCLQKMLSGRRPEEEKAALRGAEEWLDSPDESKRRAVRDLAEAAGLDTPVGALGMSIFLSGGSIAPDSAPEVQPPASVCQRLAGAAIILSAVVESPEHAAERFRQALELRPR